MDVSTGLLSGLANGLKEGLIGYQNQQNINHQRRMTELAAGVQQDAGGNLVYTPEKQAQVNLQKQQTQQGLLDLDPMSDSSKTMRDAIGQVSGQEISPSMNVNQVTKLAPFFESKYKADLLSQDKADAIKAREQERMDKASEVKKGKVIPATEAVAFGSADAANDALENAIGSIKENSDIVGPLKGRLNSLKAFGEIGDEGKRAKSLDAQLKVNAQVIGKSLEGGKLTDQDIDRYKAMLPNMNDSEAAAEQKTAILRDMIARKRASEVSSLKGAGYDIGSLDQPRGLLGATPRSSKIKVSNGKETLLIDPSDFADAKKDGYKRVN